MLKTAFLVVMSVAVPAAGQNWTNRGEYDRVLEIKAEATPAKRVALLDQWKKEYPKTELRQARWELYLSTYQTLGSWDGMLAVAHEMATDAPTAPVGLYWIALLTPSSQERSPDVLTRAEKASRQLLTGLDKKPEAVTLGDWQKQRTHTEVVAHRALGWIEWQRGSYPAAEQEFTTCLEKDPANAEISAWLGMVLALQKLPEKTVPGLWHLARATSLEDQSALPVSQRREVRTLLEALYGSYHGSAEGLAALSTAARGAVLPPAGFQIESAAVIAARQQEEELNRVNPELAAWLKIKKRLETPEGDAYFTELMASPLPKLKGALLRYAPASRPKELTLGITDPAAEEVILKLNTPLPNKAEIGIQLEFEGTAVSFTRNPLVMTIQVEREKISGWPASKAAGSGVKK